MSKFKVGDRVRIIACNKPNPGKEKSTGTEFVITKDEGPYDDEQSWSGNETTYRYKESELERVLSSADIDREMMENSEIYVQGRFSQMTLRDSDGSIRAFYDAAQMRAAFRSGYDYAMRTEASARETLASIRSALDRDNK